MSEAALMERFMETPEGATIGAHFGALNDVSAVIGLRYLDHAGQIRDGRHLTAGGVDPESVNPDVVQAELGTAVDLSFMKGPRAWGDRTTRAKAEEAYEALGTAKNSLNTTTRIMAANPNLRAGSTLSVRRNPRAAGEQPWIDSGWSLSGIRADGTLVVTKSDTSGGAMLKRVRASELDAVNSA